MHRRHQVLNIPTNILRSLVLISEMGSFDAAGNRLGLTQLSINTQMKRLEAIVGGDVFDRSTGRTTLTSVGSLVLSHAKKLLAANDQILAFGGLDIHEQPIRLGLSAFFVDQFLRECKAVSKNNRLSITSDHSLALAKALKDGYLDLACLTNPPADVGQQMFGWVEDLIWVKGAGFNLSPGYPIPLIAWPSAAQDATMIGTLDHAGLAYRKVFTSSDYYARKKAVEAGIGLMAIPSRQLLPPLLEVKEYDLPMLKPLQAGVFVSEISTSEKIADLVRALKVLLPPAPQTSSLRESR